MLQSLYVHKRNYIIFLLGLFLLAAELWDLFYVEVSQNPSSDQGFCSASNLSSNI